MLVFARLAFLRAVGGNLSGRGAVLATVARLPRCSVVALMSVGADPLASTRVVGVGVLGCLIHG